MPLQKGRGGGSHRGGGKGNDWGDIRRQPVVGRRRKEGIDNLSSA